MSRLSVASASLLLAVTTGVAWGAFPVIAPGGIVNGADFTPVFSPGILFSIFGSDLAPSLQKAGSFPLPSTLAGTSVDVLFGTRLVKAPLFFVSPGQINALLPYEVTGTSVRIRVAATGGTSATQTIAISERSPRLLSTAMTGRGDAILVHADFTLVSAAQPAAAGEVVVLFLTGLGAVSPAVASGQMAGDGSQGHPLNLVSASVAVKVDDQAAAVSFAGLAPGFAGLYQINFQVPADSPPGVPRLTVEMATAKSQETVKFAVAPGQQVLTSTLISPSGGAVDAGGFRLTVPAGAFASGASVTLAKATTGIPPASERTSEVYTLAGLPDVIPSPMTISVPLLRPFAGGSAYILVTEAGEEGGQFEVEGTVQGNNVVATLPPRESAPGSLRAAAGRWATTDLLPIMLEVLILSPTTPGARDLLHGSHILLEYPYQSLPPAEAETLKNFLDGRTLDALREMGFVVPLERILVRLEPKVAGTRDCGGYVGRAAWNGTSKPVVRLNMGLYPPHVYDQEFSGIDVLTVKGAHLLAHALQNPGRPGLAGSRWVWMDEAVATRLESILAHPDYTAPQETRGWHFQPHGLEFWATTGDMAELRDHGAGATRFIDYLFIRHGSAYIGQIYKFSKTGYLPVEALRTAAPIGPGFDISAEWRSFFESSNGEAGVYWNQKGGEALWDHESRRASLSGTKAEAVQFSWNSPDLSEQYFPVLVAGTPSAAANLRLSASVTGSANTTARFFRIRGINATLLGSGTALSGIDAAQTLLSGDEIWVVVNNKQAVAPFAVRTPVSITIELKEGKPAVDLLAILKQSIDIDIEISAHGQCQTGTQPPRECFSGESIHNRDPRGTGRSPLPITWNGNTFTVDGEFVDPDRRHTRIEVTATVQIDPEHPELSKLMNGRAKRTETLDAYFYETGFNFTNIPFWGNEVDPNDYYYQFMLPKDRVSEGLGTSYYSDFGGSRLLPGYTYDSNFYFMFHRLTK